MAINLLSVNPYSAEPVYEQLKSQIRKSILWGTLKEGDRLPTIREIALTLSINPNTIARVFRELTIEGYLKSEPGIGTFVSKIPEDKLHQDKVEQFRRILKSCLLEGKIMGLTPQEINEIFATILVEIQKEEKEL